MDIYRVAGVAINQTPMDWGGNEDRIKRALFDLKAQQVHVAVFPELCTTGYGCEDVFLSPSTAKSAETMVTNLLPDTFDLTVTLGLPYYYKGAMFNCVALIQNGRVLGLNAKKILPREGVHYEPRWFRSWPFGEVIEIDFCGQKVPMGDLSYKLGDLGLGIEICEEAWAEIPAVSAHAQNIELVINPSASHFGLGKDQLRRNLVANSSRSLKVHYVYTNLLGLESGRLIYEGGVLFACKGSIIASSDRFGFKDYRIFFQDLDMDLIRTEKLKNSSFYDFKNEHTGSHLHTGKCPKSFTKASEKLQIERDVSGLMSKNEEFLQAQMLGLFDYMRKTGSQSYVVSMSGGCDSGAIAVLVSHMVACALTELGSAQLAEKFNCEDQGNNAKDWIHYLLKCIYQGTNNSGSVTSNAACWVAKEIGATYHHVNVQQMVDGYISQVEHMIGRSLTWDKDDLALQNIQARARAPMAWLATNVFNGILLATSNRSEASVGYATMDGDTSGGLSPIAGIDKQFLREWLKWAEKDCSIGLGPLPSLKMINDQQPTAELRPKESAQKDEEDLMPYEVLNRIEGWFIRDKMPPDEIAMTMKHHYPQYTEEQRHEYLDKFIRLWRRNQWKRERYALSFHVDDYSVDPKSWCRYPVLSGPWKGVKS